MNINLNWEGKLGALVVLRKHLMALLMLGVTMTLVGLSVPLGGPPRRGTVGLWGLLLAALGLLASAFALARFRQ